MGSNIIGGIEESNKVIAQKVSSEVDRCVLMMEHEVTDRRKEGERLEKVIRDTRDSLKDEIERMAEGMKREMISTLERKMSSSMERIREENVTKIEMVGDRVIEVRDFLGRIHEKIERVRDEGKQKEVIQEVSNRVVKVVRVVGEINRMDPGSNVNVMREVWREEVPKALVGVRSRVGDDTRLTGGTEKWSEVVGRRKRGPRVVIEVKEMGEKENVREELIKCLDPMVGEVRVRNIRRQGNFVVEVHSSEDLEKLWKSEGVRKAGCEENGEPRMRDPCVIRGVDRDLEERDVKQSIWRRNKEAFKVWKEEEWDKEFIIRGRLDAETSWSSAWVIQMSPRVYKRLIWMERLYVG